MQLPTATWILFGFAAFGMAAKLLGLFCLWVILRRKLPEPKSYPPFSILKPLCGLDDELLQNLTSHVELDYPGGYEVLLGVRSEQDLAYPIARDFAAAHPHQVRLVLQQGEPGHNPKVNQLISLAREARHPLLATTDSNVRVGRRFLREHAAMLEDPKVGVSSNLFAGVGEQRLGAILDNLLIASFVCPNLAGGEVALGIDQIMGKSLAMRREVLEEIGGWHAVKDVLAEDALLAKLLRERKYRAKLCSSMVHNVQTTQPLSHYWGRHTRWLMIRFRVFLGGVVLEPILNTTVLALAGALVAFASPAAWALLGAAVAFEVAFTQVCALLARGHGFKPHHLLLVPLRDLLFACAWLRGATMRWVTWRGNRLHVLARTRLAAPVALSRVKKMQRLGR
ncbi:MAG: glycosyltransferase [Myxococcales bacterium]|nr:glycosyltransferase [Myxococcales bacterium]